MLGVRELGYEAMTYIHTRPQTSLAIAFGKHSISTDGLVHAAEYSTTESNVMTGQEHYQCMKSYEMTVAKSALHNAPSALHIPLEKLY